MLKRQPKTFKSARTLGIFLCHASEDKPVVRNLYKQLKGEGLNPWLDEEDLEGGEDWELEIPKAVRATDVVIVCLSQGSITKTGYVQKEIKEVLDVADLQPEGAIFVIPLKLEPCEVPTRLRKWQYIDLFDERGYERLLRALRKRAESISIAVTTRSMSASATLITNQNSSLSVAPTPSVALPRDVPRQTSSQQKPGWRNWGDNPVVVVISVIAAIVSIIVFVTNSFFPLPSNTQTVATNTAGNKNVSSATPTTSTLATSFSLNIQLPTAIIQSTTTSNISSAPPQPTSTRLNTPTASVTIMPTTAPTATATPPGVSISSDNLNLRTGPGTNYPVVSTYPRSTVLEAIGRTPDSKWIKVITPDGQQGWMVVEFLQVVIDLKTILLVEIPPTPTPLPPTPTTKPRPTATLEPVPQQPVQPTIAPVANLDGTWSGTTSAGGTLDFIVSNGKVTNIHLAFPVSIEPSKEGDCSANGSWAGYESWLNQLRITIGTDGSFSGRNIQIRGLDRLLAEFSGSLTSSGSASGRLREEITASETCKIISSFDWSATK